ncbi:uncharacterized protein LOC100573203 [Acyrthosiphon pisum]|uniref:Uncharacterized protein n=1 Tax=Acyrthosiphon pisum TaxID=7029 RepID=A0A8R2NMZ5_ACYPI|nr:uncharacterized protein LOC100573203 [Acyrthosiphon pisum]
MDVFVVRVRAGRSTRQHREQRHCTNRVGRTVFPRRHVSVARQARGVCTGGPQRNMQVQTGLPHCYRFQAYQRQEQFLRPRRFGRQSWRFVAARRRGRPASVLGAHLFRAAPVHGLQTPAFPDHQLISEQAAVLTSN